MSEFSVSSLLCECNTCNNAFYLFCFPHQHDAQMDYFGIKLATCSSDRAIRVFDVKQEQYTLQQELMGFVLITQCLNNYNLISNAGT